MQKIHNIENELKRSYDLNREQEERKAVERIKIQNTSTGLQQNSLVDKINSGSLL